MTRLGLISDVHGDLAALQDALGQLDRQARERIRDALGLFVGHAVAARAQFVEVKLPGKGRSGRRRT